jgi:hypothetical protein
MAFLVGIALEDVKLTLYESIFADGVELELAAVTLVDTTVALVVVMPCCAFPTEIKLVARNKE